jgi:hypothetical protein
MEMVDSNCLLSNFRVSRFTVVHGSFGYQAVEVNTDRSVTDLWLGPIPRCGIGDNS